MLPFVGRTTAPTARRQPLIASTAPSWAADRVSADVPAAEREGLLRLAAHGRKAFLGPKGEVEGAIGYDRTWRLFVNVTREHLSSSAARAAADLAISRESDSPFATRSPDR